MTFLELWLALLLAFSDGTHCDMGQPVDWYPYSAAHVWIAEESVTFPVEQGSKQQVHWLLSDNSDQIIFWYNPANMPHGMCAVLLPDDMYVSP